MARGLGQLHSHRRRLVRLAAPEPAALPTPAGENSAGVREDERVVPAAVGLKSACWREAVHSPRPRVGRHGIEVAEAELAVGVAPAAPESAPRAD